MIFANMLQLVNYDTDKEWCVNIDNKNWEEKENVRNIIVICNQKSRAEH